MTGQEDNLDVVSLTRTLVRFDTSHNGEGGITLPYAKLLEQLFTAAGVGTEIIPTPKPGNVHFIARIRGTGAKPPLLLLCHSDVVSVERDKWQVDPFAAEVRDGYLWGRGVLDMKGTNASFASALLRLVREGVQFDRDIIYVADCDEESGPYNTRWLAERHWDKLNAGAVLTEGGWILTQRDGRTPMLVSMTCLDRIFGVVRLTARGTATHSSKPMPDSAIMRLNRAVARLADHQPDVVLTELNRQYFAALEQSTTDTAFAQALHQLLRAATSEQLERAGRQVVEHSPFPWLHNALLRATVAYVIQSGGYKANVIPSEAATTLQLRFTPQGQRPTEVLDQLRQAINDPGIGFTLIGTRGETEQQALARWEREWETRASSIDTDVFAAWQRAAQATYPGVPVVPAMFEAGTSGRPWREKGIPVYGIYPYALDNESVISMHGNNERIRVDALRQGAEMMYRTFRQFSVG